MKPFVLASALIALQLGSATVRAPGLLGQSHEPVPWRQAHVARCARADTLFGRMWRSHSRTIRTGYAQRGDSTAIATMVRTASWETTSSNLVGTEAAIRVPGRSAKVDSAQLELTLRFIDTLFRAPAQAHVALLVDDSVHLDLAEPQVDYPDDVKVHGVPVVVTVLLTPSQSFAVARANKVSGTMGPYPWELYAFELWDINAIYRATVCGLE